jgi:hypothetical protein
MSQGVDIQHGNKYVVAPPSVTENEYWWVYDGGNSPLEMHAELLERCLRAPPPVITHQETEGDDDKPGTEWANTRQWGDILTEHGWVPVYYNGGTGYWRRPGKTEGISATTNHDGTDILYVFSSSAVPFEPDTGYSKFTAYTLLNFGGDFKAAARSVIQEQEYGVIGFEMADGEEGGYEFSSAGPPEHFVSKYVHFGNLQTDAPMEYHEAAALSLLALVSRGVRGQLAPFPSGLATNLYLLLVGPTSRSRKSTAQRIGLDMGDIVYPGAALPQRATTEALIDAMASRSYMPTLWTPDEFGVQISEIYSRSFLAGFEEMLLTLYGGDTYTYQKVSGVVTISGPHLNVLGVATPESLARAGSTAMESGLLPRFGVIYPIILPPPRPAGLVSSEIEDTRKELVRELREVLTYVQDEEPKMLFTPSALSTLNSYEDNLASVGLYAARLPVMLYKVGMLLALADRVDTVTEDHAMMAGVIVNRWADGANNLTRILRRSKADAEFESDLEFALATLNRGDGQLHRSVVARTLKVSASTLDRIERTLIDRALITVHNNVWSVNNSNYIGVMND